MPVSLPAPDLVVEEGAGDGVPDVFLLCHALVHDCDALGVDILAAELAGVCRDGGQGSVRRLELLHSQQELISICSSPGLQLQPISAPELLSEKGHVFTWQTGPSRGLILMPAQTVNLRLMSRMQVIFA